MTIYRTFFYNNEGGYLPENEFYEICRQGEFDEFQVMTLAHIRGYYFSRVLDMDLQDWINLAFPNEKS